MIQETYKVIDRIILSLKKHRQANNYLGLATDAMALLEYIPTLIQHSVSQEAEYRKFEAKLTNENDANGKRNSSAYSETQAKATEFYTEWSRAKLFIDLMYEMVQMSKILARGVNNEFNAH